MANKSTSDQYTVTIGIECHVQFRTKTKLFSGALNDARDAKPNTLINHIDFGLPGALPVLNRQAVEYGIRAAFALGTEPQRYSAFDRKHYFYPDLPLGYQITQFYHPIIRDGQIDVAVNGAVRTIRISEAHLEADAGKSTHPAGKDYSLVDLNRAGTPLLEIVSAPDMHSPAEARAYARELYLRMKYAGVSDVDLYHGNMRFDVNVSVSKTDELGKRTETKNLNSFKAVEKAAEYEIKRQIDLLEKGQDIVQETRGWDDAKQKTFSQRSKEDAHDYRYMPEPDIPPVVLDDEWVERVRHDMPVLPGELRVKLAKLNADESQVETLIDEPTIASMVTDIAASDPETARTITNWLTGEAVRLIADGAFTWSDVVTARDSLVVLAAMVKAAELSSTNAKALLPDVMMGGDPKALAKEKNLIQLSDTSELEKIVADVIAANPQAADDVRSGEMKAIGFLVGQVMKASKGQANPSIAQDLLKKQIGL
ncbi:Asp-tRNA(Asn)/Glu-tRNA(Gln) amidotransferase subunit GatB [Candidatus Saccharibacteria bacterium]|nr:Asp-tRNA(Asn)/Glu-tRNA(Gln) amidotransferase subunit GatB [Candidatus Saccharibacteria bacterium]